MDRKAMAIAFLLYRCGDGPEGPIGLTPDSAASIVDTIEAILGGGVTWSEPGERSEEETNSALGTA